MRVVKLNALHKNIQILNIILAGNKGNKLDYMAEPLQFLDYHLDPII